MTLPCLRPIFRTLIAILGAQNVTDGQTTAPRLRGAVDLTIGSVDETRDAHIFGNVSGLLLLEDGRILVADNTTHDVRVFGTDGKHQFTIGRRGAGPGDLNRPCCLTIGNDGQLWIRDNGNRRYSIFEIGPTEGKFVQTVRAHVASPQSFAGRVAWDSRGRVVDIGQLDIDLYQRAFIEANGSVMRWDTLKPPPSESLAVMRVQRRVQGGVSTYYWYQPHGPVALRAYGPGGETADAVSSNYSVSWFDAERNRVTLLQRPIPGPELSARERREANAELDRNAKDAGVARSSLPYGVPRRKAPLRDLGFDLDGRLWVERSVADGQPREADLYDRRGTLVAVMTWPSHIRLGHRTVRGHTAVGVAVDSLGTNTVVRLRFR
jgi:hypothetical protein